MTPRDTEKLDFLFSLDTNSLGKKGKNGKRIEMVTKKPGLAVTLTISKIPKMVSGY